MNKELLVLKCMAQYGWKKPFARQYVMERVYNGLSHNRAFNEAMKSTWVSEWDKPKGKVWN